MKQRITLEQWAELSPQAQDKARELWKPKRGDEAVVTDTDILGAGNAVLIKDYKEFSSYNVFYCIFGDGFGSYHKQALGPLFNIGQMIEILNPYGGIPVLVMHCTKHGCSIFDQDRDLINGKEVVERNELCDALWEAVKVKLQG